MTPTRIIARIPDTTYRLHLEGWDDRTTARMLAFARHHGFSEVERCEEELPEKVVTAEGELWFYPPATD